MSEQLIKQDRLAKDEFFEYDDHSPLTDAQKAEFTHLDYYPYNPALALIVEITPIANTPTAQIITTKDTIRNYQQYGTFTFDVDGESVTLTIYNTPHGFFLPFVDVNAGTETYPAGRYIDPKRLPDGRFVVDFNTAYNPYCAYNDRYDCPLTPAENRVKVAIRAGEKIPTGDWAKLK
ncbi:MAG: DUF1684 domain-containing protein [Anaerolineae bacterium]|jgi:hypothetical protein|nr:DUF1684 domain-containing protein [Anaerolineae bacterium]